MEVTLGEADLEADGLDLADGGEDAGDVVLVEVGGEFGEREAGAVGDGDEVVVRGEEAGEDAVVGEGECIGLGKGPALEWDCGGRIEIAR